MAVTTVNLSDQVSTFVTKTNTISTDLGDIDSLSTSATDLVQAINNIDARIQDVDDSSEIISIARNSLVGGSGLDYDSSTGQFSIADNAVDIEQLAHRTANHVLKMDASGNPTSGTIVADNIASSAVTNAKLASSAVTNAKLATNAVTQAKIADDAVGSAELKSVVTLTISNAAGTVLKTIYGAGS